MRVWQPQSMSLFSDDGKNFLIVRDFVMIFAQREYDELELEIWSRHDISLSQARK